MICTIAPLFPLVLTLFLLQPATTPADDNDRQLEREREQLRWKMPVRVEGTVTDAETGQPIARFKLIPGLHAKHPQGEFRRFDYSAAEEFENGEYEWINHGRQPDVIVRIEADGYEPVISEGLSDHAVARFDAKLKRAANITGTVLAPDGTPAEAAQVIFSTRDAPVTLNNEQYVQQQRGPTTDTDSEGRFEMTPLTEDWRMVVLHESGTAELSRDEFPEDGTVRLQPWARIEGTLKIGSKPAPAGTEVQYHPLKMPAPDTAYISHISEAKTDDAGRFVFDRVQPGQGRIARQIKMKGPGDYALYAGSGNRTVETKAGEIIQVELGGTGRPVVGRAVREGGYPDNWFATASLFAGPQHYCANVESDGSFRIDDVEAGTYSLEMDFREVPGQDTHIGPSVAYVSHTFTVPEMPGGRSDQPLDLRELPVKPRPQR